MAMNTAATLTGRGVNVEFSMAAILNDPSESIYAAIIFVDGGKRAYGPLLKKLSYSGGEFARVGADILLEVDNNLRINYSKLPLRVPKIRDPERHNKLRPVEQLELLQGALILYDPPNFELKEPHPLRFYARQDAGTSSGLIKEAVGFCFDSKTSIPTEMEIEDWSSRWMRWEGGRFHGFGPTYLLEFDMDPSLQLSASAFVPYKLTWERELLGTLKLSGPMKQPDIPPKQLILYAGLERTSANFLNTPIPYYRPWCIICPGSNITLNPD